MAGELKRITSSIAAKLLHEAIKLEKKLAASSVFRFVSGDEFREVEEQVELAAFVESLENWKYQRIYESVVGLERLAKLPLIYED